MVQNENTPPLRSSQPSVDIPGFFDAVELALGVHLKTEGKPDQTTPVLVHEFPKERLGKPDDKFDVITFRVVSSEMAPSMNDGSAPRSPKVREIKPHSSLNGFNIEIQGWKELVNAEFSIWSKSSRNADLVTDWFHKFMMKYAFLYKYFYGRGAEVFRFVKRADDDVDQSYGQELYRRRLTYEFRIDNLMALEQKQLTDLDITFGISGPSDTITITPTQ